MNILGKAVRYLFAAPIPIMMFTIDRLSKITGAATFYTGTGTSILLNLKQFNSNRIRFKNTFNTYYIYNFELFYQFGHDIVRYRKEPRPESHEIETKPQH
jgi:hypothetical protein